MQQVASNPYKVATAKSRRLRRSMHWIRGWLLRGDYKAMEQCLGKLDAVWRQQMFAQDHAIEIARSTEEKIARVEREAAGFATMQPRLEKLESFSRQEASSLVHLTEVVKSIEEMICRPKLAVELAALKTELAKLESAWRQQISLHRHEIAIESRLDQEIPELLNAVSTVGAFGHELSRVKRQISEHCNHLDKYSDFAGDVPKVRQRVGNLENEARGVMREQYCLWEIAGTTEEEIGEVRHGADDTASEENRRLCLHRRYTIRTHPAPYDARFDKDESQQEVYETARWLAEENDLQIIGDYGCGSASNLLNQFADRQTVGYEAGATLEYLRQTHPMREWRSSELPNVHLADCDLVICDNLIQRVDDPSKLLDAFRQSNASAFVISTPALELCSAWGISPRFGPPANELHRYEWTTAEFHRFVSKYLRIVDQKIINFRRANQLIIAYRHGFCQTAGARSATPAANSVGVRSWPEMTSP